MIATLYAMAVLVASTPPGTRPGPAAVRTAVAAAMHADLIDGTDAAVETLAARLCRVTLQPAGCA